MASSMVVERLIQTALQGMEDLDEPYTQQELLSASFTLTLRIIDAIAELYPEILPAARQGAEILMLRCATGKAN